MNNSSIYSLMGLTSDMINVYPLLREVIKQAPNYDKPLRYIAFRSATIRGSWFTKNYLPTRRQNCLKSALVAVSKALDTDEAKLAAHLEVNMDRALSSAKGITGNRNFLRLEDTLPVILEDLAGSFPVHAASLLSLANRLNGEITKTQRMLEDFKADLFSDESKAEKNPLLGQQHAAVEALINETLAKLDKKVAHNIRLLLSKADNKLLVLEQELLKLQ